jgi:pyridoxamine 5'-phosphate oxidase
MSDISEHICKLREEFIKNTLSESDVNTDPFMQFETWMNEAIASEICEVQAMCLSTVIDQKPSSRIVYLRRLHNHKFLFYGNYESKKGKSLEQNANACLNFFWPELQRQVRIEGVVKKANDENCDNYFNSRPRESQLGAWISAQSSKLSSRQELEDKLELQRKAYEGKAIPRPPFWGGWVLTANYYEFWQGRKSRLHDRIAYESSEKKWLISRLAP